MAPLPIDAVLDELKTALNQGPAAVLQAPPGAGKTTRVPPALLGEPWLKGRKIVMLEPRRLAARAAARRMADQMGEPVGRTVGYRVRMDTRVGPETRIEVVTEGVLTRMLQGDPGLSGVGLVIFDEYHERHLESDLGLALCLDLQGILNPDLRLLVMSATLDPAPVAGLLGGAPVIACEGRQHPVETRYVGRGPGRHFEAAVAEAALAAARSEAGSILVFLPGAAEIRRVLARLSSADLSGEWLLAPLFGNLSREEQDRAIAPAPAGRRKIVLATNIAETSLTIEGIRVVVDGGFMRAPRFDVRSGMTRLATVPVSRASADQRRGRAGRTEPGVCYRLWAEAAHGMLAERNSPEILQADLAALVLELAMWGVEDPARLKWLDPPPEAACLQARALLKDLGALDGREQATEHGRRMAELPLHPRLAHMLLEAQRRGRGAEACDLAAVLSERDFVKFPPGEVDSDVGLRLDVMAGPGTGRTAADRFAVDRPALRRCLRAAEALRQRLGLPSRPAPRRETGRVLAWAYPDRIGKRRTGDAGRFRLSNGRGAFFPSPEPLAAEECIVAAELDGDRREARVFLAAACDPATILEDFRHALTTHEIVEWDQRTRAVRMERSLRLGALALGVGPLENADPQRVAAALIDGIRRAGIGCLPWTASVRRWRERVLFLRRAAGDGTDWPDVSDAALTETLEDWLSPRLGGITRLAGLKAVDLFGALNGRLSWQQRRQMDEWAPTHIKVPSGLRIRVDYSGEAPVLAVRVQEMFGCAETPRVAGGRQPVLLHLLSPAGRPVQVTRDLAGFWAGSYHDVKKEMRGRYPKHHWPDDPQNAAPTRRTTKKSRN
jgi:ATP-dependent helicase HrpB